jgi:Na+/H+ antiporter NhaD/arsenite permease-like protein
MTYPQIAASFIALITFVALAAGRIPRFPINRAAMALIGGGLVMVLQVLPFSEAQKTIDLSTILLLLSMMVINAVLELAGFFTWVGNLVIERASSPMKLLVLVTFTSGVLSALFINDPVVLMLTPLVCGVVLRLRYNPIPYLIALATAANIGSAATITGNPQNILIGMSSQIPYLSFLARLGPVALVGMGLVVVVVRLVYRRDFERSGSFSRKERGGAESAEVSISSFSAPSALPYLREKKEGSSPAHPISLEEASTTVYIPILRKCLLVIAGMLMAFLAGVEIPLAAYVAACTLLFTRRIKTEKILALIDWPLLLLFFGLFIVTGSLELTGVSEKLFGLVSGLAYSGVAPLALVTTVLSNTISNVPAVLLFRPLIPQFPNPQQAWLTLAGASTLAGNLTLIGSVANLIVAEQALKFGIKLLFTEYLRAGVLVTVLSLLVCIAWLQFVV